MAKLENKFWTRIKKETALFDVLWTRIETGIILPGIPDLHGLYRKLPFWLELKICSQKRVFKVNLSPHQIGWQYLYASKGGNVWNLVHRPSSSLIYLLNGSRSPEYGASNPDPMYDKCWSDKDIPWTKVLDYIVDYDLEKR